MIGKKTICFFIMIMLFVTSFANASGLFPSMDEMLGTAMPSVSLVIGRDADAQDEIEEGFRETYVNFSVEDYIAFGEYLAGVGAIIKEYSSEGSIMTAVISARDAEMPFSYDWEEKKAIATYLSGTRVETETEAVVPKDNILPELSILEKEMPRISMALKREPSSEETLQDGSLQEIYLDFCEEDYNTFSKYLQTSGCTLEDYHTDDKGVLVINLSNGFWKMTFSYDAIRHTGTVVYPKMTRVEKGWAATLTPSPESTPKPAATPKPTEKKVKAGYSEEDCWRTAHQYFWNLRWKNPDSVKIHDHTTSYTADGYMFTIDYSAQNGFGGTNRGYYWITVDASSNKVTLAFGSE